MALVLSLRVGHDFYLNDERVVVSWIETPARFSLRKADGARVIVDDTEWVDLTESVKVMAGTPRNPDQTTIVNVMIDAPKSVVILRGALYRGKKPRKQEKKVDVVCETCFGKGVLYQQTRCEVCNGFGCPQCRNGYQTISFKCPDCG